MGWRQRRRIKRLVQERDVEAVRAMLRDEDDDLDRGIAARALRQVAGKQAADDLLVAATSGGYWTRLAALDELVKLGDHRVADPAVAAIKELDFHPRATNEWELLDMLTDVIARIDASAVMPPLRELLADASPTVRCGVVQAIGKLDDVRTRPLLERAVTDPDDEVRQAARTALGNS